MGGKGSGGRNRKPTAVKKAQGNAGKRKLNDREPVVNVGAPAMPDYLSESGRAEWNRLVPILLSMKVLTPSDGDALAALCCAHSQFVEAQHDLVARGNLLDIYQICQLNGFPIVGRTGKPKAVLIDVKKNPSVQVASDADKRLRSYYAMFGLDPSSRSRLTTNPNDPPQDPLDDFLSRKTAGEKVQ